MERLTTERTHTHETRKNCRTERVETGGHSKPLVALLMGLIRIMSFNPFSSIKRNAEDNTTRSNPFAV